MRFTVPEEKVRLGDKRYARYALFGVRVDVPYATGCGSSREPVSLMAKGKSKGGKAGGSEASGYDLVRPVLEARHLLLGVASSADHKLCAF